VKLIAHTKKNAQVILFCVVVAEIIGAKGIITFLNHHGLIGILGILHTLIG